MSPQETKILKQFDKPGDREKILADKQFQAAVRREDWLEAKNRAETIALPMIVSRKIARKYKKAKKLMKEITAERRAPPEPSKAKSSI